MSGTPTRIQSGLVLSAGAYAIAGGLFSLLGWLLEIPRLKDWANDGITIKANTAICALVAGVALVLSQFVPRAKRPIRALGGFVALVGGLTLSQHLTGWSLGIDTLLFHEAPGAAATAAPGRMGPPASTSFLLLGVGLVLTAGGTPARKWAAALALVAVCISGLSLTGYAYGASQLYQIPLLTGIALQSATMVFALGIGVIASMSEHGLGAALTRRDAGGVILRRLIVPVILLPVIIGWIRLRGQEAGYYDTAFGSAARSLLEIGFLLGLLWWTARGISRSDAALRASEAELTEAQHLAHIGGWNWDAQTDVVKVSPELYRIFGLDPLQGRFPNFRDQPGILYPKESWERINEAVQRTMQTGLGYELDVDAFRCGQLISVTTRGEAVQDATGRIVALRGTVQDITERTRAEAAMRESEKRYRSLFESIDEGFCVVEVIFDPQQRPIDYRFLETNPAFEQHTGLMSARGKRMRELVPNHDSHWFETYGRVALTGEATRFENYSASMDRWFNVYAFRIGQPEERKVALLFTDITERKRAEEVARHSQREVAAANEQLAAANEQLASRAKQLDSLVEQRTAKLREAVEDLEAFSYSMAHDLRGPLRTLQGFSDILIDDYAPLIDETGRSYLARIGSAAGRMNRLISDVLAYSRITSDPFLLEPVELNSVADEVIEHYPALQEVSIRVADHLPAVLANRAALTQVLSNLLTNAMKFVGNGSAAKIELIAEQEADWVTLSVRDNGIGIAPEHHHRIFRMFERVNSEKKFEGTGIGLAIVRRAVERMGGTVGVESKLGEGSRFWVKLKRSGNATWTPDENERSTQV